MFFAKIGQQPCKSTFKKHISGGQPKAPSLAAALGQSLMKSGF